MATNKRPLVSTASPSRGPTVVPTQESHTAQTSQTQRPTPASSLPSLPPFLTLPRSTILQKFRQINQHEILLRANPTAILTDPIAISRNRYPDIHPWSHNRILLRGLDFPYINASPIDLGRKNEQFIATQGPVGTYREGVGGIVKDQGGNGSAWENGGGDGMGANLGFGHFWEMVWQEGAEVLIMLTKCVEQGREKCGVYYPDAVGKTLELEGEIDGWGDVTCESLHTEYRTEVRQLKLVRRKHKAPNQRRTVELDDGAGVDVGSEFDGEVQERRIWHFLFLGWPDQEVPQTEEDQKALLELIDMTRFRINAVIDHKSQPQVQLQSEPTPPPSFSLNPSNSTSNISQQTKQHKPRIVHCSAGVGRTGTFIALDYLLQELEEGKFDDMAVKVDDPIFECVKKLREQRMFMVYQPGQFAFIYQILRERWLERVERLMRTAGEDGSPTKKRKVDWEEKNGSG